MYNDAIRHHRLKMFLLMVAIFFLVLFIRFIVVFFIYVLRRLCSCSVALHFILVCVKLNVSASVIIMTWWYVACALVMNLSTHFSYKRKDIDLAKKMNIEWNLQWNALQPFKIQFKLVFCCYYQKRVFCSDYSFDWFYNLKKIALQSNRARFSVSFHQKMIHIIYIDG